MPAGDQTGPRGQGPMTGRGAGYCGGYAGPGYMNPGRPYGGNWGGGRGWRHMHYATGRPGWMRYGYLDYMHPTAAYPYPEPPTPEQETEMLKQQQSMLKQQLDDIDKRLGELSKSK